MVLDSSAAAHQHVHLARSLRQEDGGLPGRISPAHHDHVLALAQLRLDVSGAVVDPLALELLQILRASACCTARRWRSRSARAAAQSPLSSTTSYGRRSQLSRTTLRAIIILAPNFCAWVVARVASSCPETPVGNPR